MIPSRAAAGQVTPGDDDLPLGDYDPTIAVRIECAACGHLMLLNAQWPVVRWTTPTSDSPLSTSCTPSAASKKPNTFSVTSIRLGSSLLLTCTAQRNTTTSNASTVTSTPTATASTATELASADKVTRTTIPAGLSRYGTASGKTATCIGSRPATG